MSKSVQKEPREGLKIFRALMVLSSMSPLFILWAIRGNSILPDTWLIPICGMMIIIPNGALWLRWRHLKTENVRYEVVIGGSEDHRVHLLAYLFTTLLPLYPLEITTDRDLIAMIVALVFIVFLFWHLNLHYMNLIFAIFGYRVFTVHPPLDDNPYTGKNSFVLISRRRILREGDRIITLPISDFVHMEETS